MLHDPVQLKKSKTFKAFFSSASENNWPMFKDEILKSFNKMQKNKNMH